jgi:hypothetical protein
MRSTEWEFTCENFAGDPSAHTWTQSEVEPEVEPLTECPQCGLEPVEAVRWVPADRAAFVLVPAALTRTNSAVRREGLYFVEIVDPESKRVIARSRNPVGLGDAIDIVGELSKSSMTQALQRAARMGFEIE